MTRTALLFVAVLLAATAAGAQQIECPDTHYPCGTGSCCSK